MTARMILAAAATGAFLSAGGVAASSDDAWEEFRTEVRDSCIAAADLGAAAEVLVDPFGTESYGVALSRNADGIVVCIFDKQSRTTEVSVIPAG